MRACSCVQVAVVPAAEWQRITGSLGRRERELQLQREAQELKQERKHLSQSIVKHWENTIEVGSLSRQCIMADADFW